MLLNSDEGAHSDLHSKNLLHAMSYQSLYSEAGGGTQGQSTGLVHGRP